MKPAQLVCVLILTVVQMALFLGLWLISFYTAQAFGRFGRSDFGFDITVSFGAFLIGFLCLISSVVAILSSNRKVRWLALLGALTIWSFWMIPSFGQHPFRGSVYYMLGCGVLLPGSVLAASNLFRRISTKAQAGE